MAIKIGHYYITRNNPREILWLLARKQDQIDESKNLINKMLADAAFDPFYPYLKRLLKILERNYDYYDKSRIATK